MDACRAEGANFASKIVRGGYMVQEHARASEQGYASPVWSSYEETNSCYNGIIKRMMDGVAAKSTHLMVASHNQDSVELAKRL